MKKLTLSALTLLLAGSIWSVSAGERRATAPEHSLSHHFSAQYYFLETVDDYYRERYKNVKKLDSDQKFDWAVCRHTKTRLVYGGCVENLLGRLSDEELDIFIKIYRAWKKYYTEEYPSTRNFISGDYMTYGMEIDVQRLAARSDSFHFANTDLIKLVDYEYFANRARVRFADGKRRMRFGEVAEDVMVAGKNEVYIMSIVLPNTFVKVQDGKVQWISCIKTCDDPIKETYGKYYFCTWDKTGEPLAVYPINLPANSGIIDIRGLEVEGNTAKISAFDCKNKKEFVATFPIEGTNNNGVEL